MRSALRSKRLVFILCPILAGALLLSGCGLLGGRTGAELPEGFSRVLSLPLPEGIRVTSYHGTGSIEDAMDAFIKSAERDGWRVRVEEGEAEGRGALFSIAIFDDADADAEMAMTVLAKGNDVQVLTVTRAGDKILVGTIIGPEGSVGEFYAVEGGEAEDEIIGYDPGDDDAGDGEVLPEIAEFENVLEMIETFAMLQYSTQGGNLRYEYVGVEEHEGESTYRVKIDNLDIWVDMETGEAVKTLQDGQEVFMGNELGNAMLGFLVTWIQAGIRDFVRMDSREDWVTEDVVEPRDFGPTTMNVRSLTMRMPHTGYTVTVEYADVGPFYLLTRYSAMGMDILRISEFELR